MKNSNSFLLFVIFFLFSSVTLVSCSRVEFGFRWIDTLVVSQVDSLVGLTSEQEDQFKQGFRRDLEAWRKNGIPEIVSWLKKVKGQLQRAPSSAEVHSDYVEGQALFQQQLQYFQKSFFTLVENMNQEQWKHYFKKAEEKDQELLDDVGTPTGAEKEQRKRLTKTLEFFFGDLDSNQEHSVEQFCKEHKFPFELQILNKKKNRTELSNVELKKNLVEKWFQDLDTLRTPEYRIALASFQAELEQFLLQFFGANLNEKQRKRMLHELDQRISDLEKLSLKQSGL